MSKQNNASIRIVKKKKSHGGHHGGSWKVAYADFVTAMMAFFLVMWIIGLNQSTKAAIAAYFQDPVAFMEAVKVGNAPFAIASEIGAGEAEFIKPEEAAEDLEKLNKAKAEIEKMIQKTPEFDNLKEFVQLSMVDEGLKIDLVEAKESLFFDSASAHMKPEARRLLTLIARELSGLNNKVIIEGHTDSRPLNRRDGYTNWELSADRANSARNVLGAAGIVNKRVGQIRGCADTQPRNPKDTTHFSNRRVSIIVVTKAPTANQKISAFSLNDKEKEKEADKPDKHAEPDKHGKSIKSKIFDTNIKPDNHH